jgi:hypothetical protein
VYRQNFRFSTTPLPLFPLKINLTAGKRCRNWLLSGKPEKNPGKTRQPSPHEQSCVEIPIAAAKRSRSDLISGMA